MESLLQEAATLKASNLILKKAIMDERYKSESAYNLLVAQKEMFKRETLASLEPVHVKKDLILILKDYHSEFLAYYSLPDTSSNLKSNLEFQIHVLENSFLKVNTEIINVLHAILDSFEDKCNDLVMNTLLASLRICWIRKILAEKGVGSHSLISSLSFVLLSLDDLKGYSQRSKASQYNDIDIKSVLTEAKNAQKLHDLSVVVQKLDVELLQFKQRMVT